MEGHSQDKEDGRGLALCPEDGVSVRGHSGQGSRPLGAGVGPGALCGGASWEGLTRGFSGSRFGDVRVYTDCGCVMLTFCPDICCVLCLS